MPISLKLLGSYSTIGYYNMNYIFSNENSVALNFQREVYAKMKVMFPFLNRRKAEIGIGVANIKDQYIPSNIFNLNNPEFDQNKLSMFSGLIKLEGNTLNAKVFPTKGMHETLTAQFVIGKEEYRGVTDVYDNALNQFFAWNIHAAFLFNKEAFQDLPSNDDAGCSVQPYDEQYIQL